MNLSCIFGADIVPVPSNYEMFSSSDIETLFGRDLLSEIKKSKYLVFNLETPLTDTLTPVVKTGPNLIAPTSTVAGLAALNPTLITLSNNHILDQGQQGLFSTISTLTENGIPYIGVGETPEDAASPYIIEQDGIKVGIYACAEHEFSIVNSYRAGANPFDPLDSLDHISQLKERCNYVVVSYHGGKEFYRYPTPETMRRCRKMVAKGADLVLCQHTHCIGCAEKYQNGTIIYGQGNFHFDRSNAECWQTSLLIRADFDNKMQISYIPIHKEGPVIRLASDAESETIFNGFYSRSEQIKDRQFVDKAFLDIANSQINDYFAYIAGYGTNEGIEAYTSKNLSPENLAFLFNCINCEPHREVIMTASWSALYGAM